MEHPYEIAQIDITGTNGEYEYCYAQFPFSGIAWLNLESRCHPKLLFFLLIAISLIIDHSMSERLLEMLHF